MRAAKMRSSGPNTFPQIDVVRSEAWPSQRWTRCGGTLDWKALTPKACRKPLGMAGMPMMPAAAMTSLTLRQAVVGSAAGPRRARSCTNAVRKRAAAARGTAQQA
jgi:hypothetical protein